MERYAKIGLKAVLDGGVVVQDKISQEVEVEKDVEEKVQVETGPIYSVKKELELDNFDTTSSKSINSEDEFGPIFPEINANYFNDIKLCSTGITSSYLPIKNQDGKFEWKFSDEFVLGNELDAFKIKNEAGSTLSPTVSNSSSNNESILSEKNKVSPPTTHSLPYSDSNESGKVHQCPHCDATFKIRGYLTRHLKKHATKKAYSCPFHKFSIYVDDNNITHKCHPNGGFSRRDTYKTHLKSRHFKYPKGTKTKDRVNSSGNCSMCNEFFPNAEIWCELHVEGGECKFLPLGFKGKSRIKNRLKRQLKNGQSVQELLLPNESINSQDMDYETLVKNNQYESVVLKPYLDTPNSEISNPAVYDYHNSPMSISSLIPNSTSPNHFKQKYNHSNLNQVNNNDTINHMPQATNILHPNQISQQHSNLNTLTQLYDYDDDFCLDSDQLNFSWNNQLHQFNLTEPV